MPLADRARRRDHVAGDLVQSLFGEAVRRSGDAQRGEHRTGVVPDRRRDRVEAVLLFLDRAGVSVPDRLLDLRVEFAG